MSPPHTDTTASPPLSHDVGTPSGQACYSSTRATPDTDTPRDPVEHSYDKDRPWTPAVKRVAEPVMLHITILLNNTLITTIASSHPSDVDHDLPRPQLTANHIPSPKDRGQSPRSNPLVGTPQHPPSLCVVDYPLFLVA